MPLRILHVAPRLSDRGGADQHLLSLLRLLDGHVEQRLAVGRVDGGVSAPCSVQRISGLDSPRQAPCDLSALADDVDVLHLHNLVNPTCMARLAGSRKPWLFTMQDHRFFCPGRGKWTLDGRVCREPMGENRCKACFESNDYFEKIIALTSRRMEVLRPASAIHVLSRYMAGELEAVGLDAARIRVIPPHADLPRAAGTPPARDRILFAGRLVAAKGVEAALEAWRRSGVDHPLVFVGTGSARKELEAAGLEVTGWLDRAGVARQLARARALLMPSRWQEPFGIVGLEALAQGVPVVAWDSGGIREWHPGPLTAWGDVDALAIALKEALCGKETRSGADPGPAKTRRDWLSCYESLAG